MVYFILYPPMHQNPLSKSMTFLFQALFSAFIFPPFYWMEVLKVSSYAQLDKIGAPLFFLPFRSVEFFQSELQWEHGDNLGVSHTCLFLGLDMPIKQLMTFLFQTHQKTFCYISDTQAKPRFTAVEEQRCSPNRFEFPYDEPSPM